MRALGLALAALLVTAPGAADPPRAQFLPPLGAPGGAPSASSPSKKAPSLAVAPMRLPDGLTLVNVHTREAVVLDAERDPGEPPRLARFFRDRTNWQEHAIAPEAIATVRLAATRFAALRGEVISGYRSDKMNELLRKKGRHVAPHSQHVLGNAVDFRLVGVPTALLLRFVRLRHTGGVGFYPDSGFVHVDAGPRRAWGGS